MRDRPCHSTLHLHLGPLPPRPPVSFLHWAPRPSHPLMCKSPIKSHYPKPCSLKQGLPLDFRQPAVESTVSRKSPDILFQSGLEVCKLWVWTFLLCCVKPQSLPGSGDGSGELSRFCSVDVALNLALVQGIMQRSTGAPHNCKILLRV
jgi:hypothetical protein